MEATNLSEKNRKKMLTFLEQLKEKNNDDISIRAINEIVNQINSTRYGLVWEQHEERVDVELKNKIPVFTELEDYKIKSDKTNKYNFLLEGDNLHSLYLLEKTHFEKIDLIYIDPPYNTGNKDNEDFKYNDVYVEKEDRYRHSKWLSFMKKRLYIAYKLLKKEGLILISIDDHEQAQLKLLCDEIFGDDNCIAILPTIMNLKGNQDQFGFAGTHEYTLVYAKNKEKCKINTFDIDEDEMMEKWSVDSIGYYKKGATLRATGAESKRENRPYMFYPILIKDEIASTITQEEFKKLYNKDTNKFDDDYLNSLIDRYKRDGFSIVLPLDGNNYGRWRWGYNRENNERLSYDIIITKTNKGYSLNKKQRPEIGELPTKKPKTLFYKPEYSSGNGTNQLVEILGEKKFNNPKPKELIKDFIKICAPNNNSIILDFFAGSGTTGQAVLELNDEDKGDRNFILCTDNYINSDTEIQYFIQKKLIKEEPKKNTNAHREWEKEYIEFKKSEQFKKIRNTEEYINLGICRGVCYPRLKTIITGIKNDNSKYNEKIESNLKYYTTDWVNRKPIDYFLQPELCKHIKEMIEIENNIEVDNYEYILILNKEDLNKYIINNKTESKIKKIWINEAVILSNEEMKKLNNYEFKYIPRNYFSTELREVGE